MTLIFLEGFETYNGITDILHNALAKKWSARSGATLTLVSGGRKNLAGKYLSLSPGTGGNRGALGKILSYDGVTSVITGVAIKFSTTPGAIDGTASNALLAIYDEFNSLGNFLYPTTLGDPEAWQIGDQPFTMTGFTYGAWHYLEAKISFSSGTTWNATVKLNGTQMFNSTTDLNVANVRSIHYINVADSTASLYLDDIYISDNTGSVNNDFMIDGSECMIEAITPNTDANYTQWVPKPPSANHYTSINTDDQTNTVVYTDVVNNSDSYNCSNLGYLNSTINGICITTLGKNTLLDSGAVLRQFTRIGGTDYTAGDYTSPNLNSVNFIGHNTGVDVNPATNNPWTIAEINALEVGIQYVAGGGAELLSIIVQPNGLDIVFTFSNPVYSTQNESAIPVDFNVDGGDYGLWNLVDGQNTTTITVNYAGISIYDVSKVVFGFISSFFATSDDSSVDASAFYGLEIINNSTLTVPNNMVYFGGSVDPQATSWMVNGANNYATDGSVTNHEVILPGDLSVPTSMSCGASTASITNLNGKLSLSSALTGLGYFYSHGNMLIEVVHLSSPNLVEIWVQDNQLTEIAEFPSTLLYIKCHNNNLTSLPTLPSGLLELACLNNALTSMPSLPSTMTFLNCSFNNLTSLPTLPSSLQFFHTAYNSLTSLPSIPANVEIVNCHFNSLTSFSSILSTELYFFSCFENPNLTSSEVDGMLVDIATNTTSLTGILRCMNTAVPTATGYAAIATLNSLPNWGVYHDLVLYTGGSITPDFGNWSATWFSVPEYSPVLHASGNDVITDNTIYALVVNESLDGTFDFTHTLIDTLEIHAGLSQSAVDAILYHYDNAYSNPSGWSIDLTGNTAPSGAGLASKASLEGKGVTVLVD